MSNTTAPKAKGQQAHVVVEEKKESAPPADSGDAQFSTEGMWAIPGRGLQRTDIVLDGASTCHMVPHDVYCLESFKELEVPKRIELAGKSNYVTAIGSGVLKIGDQSFFVLSVPDLQFTVISESLMVEKGAVILARDWQENGL
jgi:hypothetical protein